MRHALVALAASLAASACSTYQVRERYQPGDTDRAYVDYRHESADLRVSIDSNNYFFSIGPPGLPLIPTYIRFADPVEVVLRLRLRLHREQDFSFTLRPCMAAEGVPAFCPQATELMAIGVQTASPLMPEFRRPQLVLDSGAAESRVGRARIYAHYAYSGVRPWDRLDLQVTYRYKCRGACPGKLELDAASLVSLDGKSMAAATLRFERVRESNYYVVGPALN